MSFLTFSFAGAMSLYITTKLDLLTAAHIKVIITFLTRPLILFSQKNFNFTNIKCHLVIHYLFIAVIVHFEGIFCFIFAKLRLDVYMVKPLQHVPVPYFFRIY